MLMKMDYSLLPTFQQNAHIAVISAYVILHKAMRCGVGEMGKNLKATDCKDCPNGICYYGAERCFACQIRRDENEREDT